MVSVVKDFLKKQRACKPGSVLFQQEKCLSFISTDGHPSALATYPPASDEQSYMRRCTWSCNPSDVRTPGVAIGAVGSYPAFSPLPSLSPAVVFCYVSFAFRQLPVRKHGALRCPDFPPLFRKATDRLLVRDKITYKMSDMGFDQCLKPVSRLVKSR